MKTLLTKTWSSLRFILIIIAGWLIHTEALAQNEVAIGSLNTNPKAILWLNGNGGQGLLLPAMTTAQRNSMGLNNINEKGMMVFDNQVNAVFYWSGSEWVQAGSTGGSGGNQTLTINGNVFTLSGSPASTVPFSFTTPSGGQVLMWNGAANRWEAVSAGNDLSGPYNSSTVVGVRGKSIPALPTTGTVRALIYDPSGAGTWQFQEISAGGGSVTNVTGTAPVTVTNPTTTPIISLAAAGITNALLANDAVTSAKILDGTITGADIANTTITANKLAQSGATNNQILQWNGTNWVPVTLAGGGSVTNVATGTGLTGGPITTTGTISIAAGGVGNTELANDAVTSAKIADATITGADIANTTITSNKLAQSAATPGQVLKWNGTNWLPSADDVGGGATPTLNPGQILIGDGTSNAAAALSGDATLAGGVLTITNNAITTAKIADATITGADIANTTITANKLAQSAATPGQVLKWNGTNWLPSADDVGGGATPTLNPGQILIGDGVSNAAAALSGDATLAGGVLTIANNAITTTKINNNAVDATKLADNAVNSAKIADASITGADIANTTITANKLAQSGATNNQVLQWNGSNWLPVTLAGGGSVTNVATGAGLTGGPITTTGTIAIATGGVDNTMLADNAVTSIKIADATITGADIANTTITANKLAQSAATPGQVLKWNGTNWLPSADDVGGGATPTLNPGQILIGDGTSNAAAALSGDATLAGGVLTIANNAITTAKINVSAVDATKLADNAVTSAKIADATITGADIANTTITANKLAQSGATNDQVLQWNGTNWAPVTIPGASIDLTAQTGVLLGDGSTITGSTAGPGARGILGSNNNNIAWVTGTPNQLLGTDATGDFQFTDKSNFVFSTANSVPRGNGTGLVASAIQDNGTVTAIGGAPVATNRLTVSAGTQDNVIQGTTTRVGAGANTAFRGDASGSTTSNFGVYGNSFGAGSTAVGVYGSAGTATTASGVSGFVGGGGITTAYGVQGTTTATGTTNYGIYGSASGATTNWAGYFAGNTAITGGLGVGGTPSFGTAGQVLTSAGPGVAPTWASAGGGGWGLTGNAGTVDATNFIGTTDNIPLNFRVNDQRAGRIDPTAVASTFFGYQSGNVTTGSENTGFGFRSLLSNTTGNFNAAVGFRAMVNNTTGSNNTAVGNSALVSNTTANHNTAMGTQALSFNTGGFNSAFGSGALLSNTTGVNNSGLGYYALVDNTTGSQNSAVGLLAGRTMTPANANTTGSLNTFLGYASGPGTPTQLNNATAIGANATVSQSNSLVLGSISGVNGAAASTNIGIGISNPSNLLHVAGDVGGNGTVVTLEGHSGSATRGPGISLIRSKGTVAAPVAVVNGDYLGGFSVAGRTASAYNLSSAIDFHVDGAVAGTSVPGRITFSTTLVGASTFAERMRINNAGNVGIGTTAPVSRIQVDNNTIARTAQFLNSFGSTADKFATYAFASGTGSGNNYGAAFDASGSTGINYAVSGVALGSSGTKIAVHGNASGTGTNWAGFFEGGNVHIQNNLGIGTTTPTSRLDISGNTLLRGINTNTPPTVSSGVEFMTGRAFSGALIAGQTSADIAFNWGGASGGFRHFIQTRHNSVANSNSNSIDFYVNNSTTAAGSISPNNTVPNGNVHGMSITATGVGIGTAAPARKFHVQGSGTQYMRIEGTGTLASGGLELDGTGTADWRIVPQLGILTFHKGDVNGTMGNMYLMNQGNFIPGNTDNPNPTLGQSTARWGTFFTTVAPNVSSDYRLKNNIKNINYGLKEILELRPVSYTLKTDTLENVSLGLIAQEVQKLIPEVVTVGDDEEKTLGMRYTELVPVLIKALQEQQEIIDNLKTQNATYADETEKMAKEIDAIKRVLGMSAKKED